MKTPLAVGMIGASGAVGGHVAAALTAMPAVRRMTLIGRRPVMGLSGDHIEQHVADVMDPQSYRGHLDGLTTAICTLGVGEPSKVTREAFVRVDKQAVLDFAAACKGAGVSHFSLLSSVGANARSRNFFLATKGELEDGLRGLGFARLSLFHPSIILTPTNRYGASQAVVLAVWPIVSAVLVGPTRRFRGIAVDRLGCAMARNLIRTHSGEEVLHFDEIERLMGVQT
jgi:uncharacterized protein YbjT (DUF2867 family)